MTTSAEQPEKNEQPERETKAKTRSLPDITEGDRSSITDVNGTVARFEMTYAPPVDERVRFAAPLRQRIPSLVFLAIAAAAAIIVALAYRAPGATKLFVWIVEGDRGRAMPSQAFVIVFLVCALGTVLRAQLRGVTIDRDWILVRTLLPLGIPQAKRWGWPQVNRIIVDRRQIALELNDGSFNPLPPVQDPVKLRDLLFSHAVKKKIQVTLLDEKE